MRRRDLLKRISLLAAGSVIGTTAVNADVSRQPVLRIAHLTDMHLPEKKPAVTNRVKSILAEIRKQKSISF